MKQLSGMRPASKAMGDDLTRTRFVKTEKRHQGHKTALMPQDATGTRFTGRILQPDANILVSGFNNIKIGKIVRKGRLRGYHIFTLSLEERKTCPTSCQHWQTCYGNNMPFAKRVDHTHPDFLSLLEASIAKLCATAKKRGSGILVRLHALGDFFQYALRQFLVHDAGEISEPVDLRLYRATVRNRDRLPGQRNERDVSAPLHDPIFGR